MAFNEEARIPVYLNDEQAKAALKNLTKEAEKWRQKMQEAMVGGDMKGMKEAEKEMKKLTNEANKLKREAFDINKVLNNLNGASINDLKKAMSALRREQAGLNRDSKEYQQIQGKIGAIKGEFDKINGKITNQQGLLGNIVNSAKQLLPAFSFAAIATAAVAAFTKIKNATDTLSTQWDIFMGGMTQATNEFFRTLATGDWSNFLDNMKEAVRVGREYQETLDKIDEQQRAMDIYDADTIREKAELEIKLRSKGFSQAEREAAGLRRIQIEEELANRRAEIAQKAYDNELMIAAAETKLSGEQVMQLARDFGSAEKIRAEAYNEKYTSLKKSMFTEKEISAILGKDFTQSESLYAAALRNMGDTSDEQLNKVVSSYVKLKQAQDSALTNTKRIRVQVANLLAGKEEDGGGSKSKTVIKGAAKSAADAAPAMITAAEVNLVNEKSVEMEALKAMEADYTDFMEAEVNKQIDILAEQYNKEKEIEQARKELKQETIDAIGQIAGSLASMAKEGSAAQIAALAVEKAAAIAQIVWNTFIANAKARAMSPATLGMPWTGINTAIAAANIATIVGTTITGFKDKRNNNKPGFYDGGYTSGGSDSTPVGMVHANEFVASAQAVRNPTIKPILDIINTAQKTNRVATIDMNSNTASNPKIEALLAANIKMMQAVIDKQPTLAIDKFEREQKKYVTIKKYSGL